MRFNHNGNTIIEATNYMHNKAVQLLKYGYTLTNINNHDWGIDATFIKGKEIFQSLYILEDYRGKGYYRQNVRGTIITMDDCLIHEFLESKQIKYVMEDSIPFQEYLEISDYYGDGKAKRSGAYFMNHIDEGLMILKKISASPDAFRAYSLHPILQDDKDLLKNKHCNFILSPYIMMLVMEYRSVANEYLSPREIDSIDEIRLSPLSQVNEMLIADKVQNKKDFMLHHYGEHPRSEELLKYFNNWHDKLGIDREMWTEIPEY